MRFREIPPAPALAGLVRLYWTLQADAPADESPAPERILPDGSPELIVHLGEPYVAASGPQPRSLIVGQLTGPLLLQPSRRTRIVAVRFEPHGLAAFLPLPAHELRDGVLSVDEAWGGEAARLAERLHDGDAGPVLDAFLLARLRPGRCGRVGAAVEALRASAGRARIGDLARRSECTPRQLERSFLRDVGVSPKRLARTFRLQRALTLLRRPELPLADVALLSGHADQSHLVREMRDLAGVTPSEMRAAPPEMAVAIGAA